jgi:hypothetical protein
MATITLDRSGAATNLRAIFSSGALYLPAAGGALQAHSGTPSDYHVAATSSVALEGQVNRHTFTIPMPAALPVTLDVAIVDIVAHVLVGIDRVRVDAAGVIVDEQAAVADVPIVQKLLTADRRVDISDPEAWELVLIEQGTGELGDEGAVELLRQKMYDVHGNPLKSDKTVPGQAISEGSES